MVGQDETVKQELKGMSESDDENCFTIGLNRLLKSKFGNLKLRDIPAKTAIYAYGKSCNDWVFYGAGEDGYVSRCKAIEHRDLDAKCSVNVYGAKMVEVIKSMSPDGTITLNQSDEDGGSFYIWFSVKTDGKATLKEAVAYVEKIEENIEKQANALLNQ